eukprot:Blabericola_migrator_1__259@NODE_1069_length_5537_cov_108_299452_g79_i1_p1_GENE_NODE_1069_length_5537_cov_108_299452_g79_i1NODE_1069_length_5537_cov_108_299452_g79_i1_p1_ORF_typecomplete_len549_score81_15DEAD/PF00270_29/6_6e26DEAD/PF00270_29/2_6e03Helicase_C/PF00271_31/1_2e21ResIII/PF04851_15/9e06ResIII/PF04851_15/8_7e03AAA_19/PF13245_6/0_047_NODE_1069_length_5537_cov_108_299452_g79_i133144960
MGNKRPRAEVSEPSRVRTKSKKTKTKRQEQSGESFSEEAVAPTLAVKPQAQSIELVTYEDAGKSFGELVKAKDLVLDTRILAGLKGRNLQTPTPLQRVVIPIILEGSDCIIRAATGTGKTLAFGVPLLSSLCATFDYTQSHSTWRERIAALILAPSKELATQISGVLTAIANQCYDVIGVWCLVQAPNKLASLQVPPSATVIVGHPGSVYKTCQLLVPQLKKSETTLFPNLKMFVMDEADLILSVFGYKNESSELFRPTPSKWGGRSMSVIPIGNSTSARAQIVLASATLNEEIHQLERLALYEPVVVSLTNDTEELDIDVEVANHASRIIHLKVPETDALARAQINEYYMAVNRKEREDFLCLLGLLQKRWLMRRTLVFTREVVTAYKVYLFLKHFRHNVGVTTPTQSLKTRLNILQQFNQGVYDILVACDLPPESVSVEEGNEEVDADALKTSLKSRRKTFKGREDKSQSVSRGLDFRGVQSVVNFELPETQEIYIHRIGRAAREFKAAGIVGTSLTLVEKSNAEELKVSRRRCLMQRLYVCTHSS